MHRYPYTLVAGQGLGVSYSSLAQLGALLPSRSLGQGEIKVYPDLTPPGNVVVKDRAVAVQEANGELNLGYVYNSQTKGWRFSQDKQLKSLDANTLVLTEGDGHETTYTYDEQRDVYVAPACAEGTPVIRKTVTGFEWHHPKTKVTESYNVAGYLQSRRDDKGRTTQFIYNASNELVEILGPSKSSYQIRNKGLLTELYAVTDKAETLLQSSQFNADGHLLTTQIPGGYQITYHYDANTKGLNAITQSDGTELHVAYEGERIKSLQAGDALTTVTYLTADTVQIHDGTYTYQVTLDEQGRIKEFWQPKDSGWNKTLYHYHPAGQLESVTHPDGKQTAWQYDKTTGLVTRMTSPTGRVTDFHYDNQHPEELIAKVMGPEKEPVVTRYIYDTHPTGFRYLRFELSPIGGVTEYEVNDAGFTTHQRVYLQAAFDVSALLPTENPSLDALTHWTAQQPKNAIALTALRYDSYGQVENIQRYGHINPQGEGIADDAMQEERFTRDRFGSLLSHAVRQQGGAFATTTQRFDALQRLLVTINPVEEETRIIYNDGLAERITLHPNGRQDIAHYDKQGLIIASEQRVDNQARITALQRDSSGRLQLKTLPDGRQYHVLQDAKGRPLFQVSATGIVETYHYDEVTHIYQHTAYSQRIVMADWLKAPTLANLLSLLKPSSEDRTDTTVYDADGNIRYEINAEKVIKETRYNALGKPTDNIIYHNPLSDVQLAEVLAGKPINLPFDATKGRAKRCFYHKDLLMAEQDAAGYCVEYERDGAGRIIKTVRYATPTAIDLTQTDWLKVKPASSAKDAITYHVYDGLDKPIREVDGEGYVTDFVYTADRLLAKQTRYYTKVDEAWLKQPQGMPSTPTAHAEDEVIAFSYDKAGRKTEVRTSNNKQTTTAYDVMGRIIAEQSEDILTPGRWEGDSYRATQLRYNKWGELIAKATPFVAQELARIEADPSLNPEEKAKQKAQVWQTKSLRHTYDETTGLLLSTTNGLCTTYYFYNEDRRLVASIDSLGAVTERVLNTFGEPLAVRKTLKPLDTRQYTLTGGLLSAEFQAVLAGLRDNAKDAITVLLPDRLGRVVMRKDAEGYMNKQRYNAFNECEEEQQAVGDLQPSLIIRHQYEGRGLEVVTERQAGNEVIREEKRYDNLYGKCTYDKDSEGESHYEQDKLGRTIATKNPLGYTQSGAYDAKGRLTVTVDEAGHTTVYAYSQPARTTTVYRVSANTAEKQQVITANVFGEEIGKENALGQKESMSHAPDGQVLSHRDSLGYTTGYAYNHIGWKLSEELPDGTVNTHAYNPRGEVVVQVKDAKGQALTTRYERNSLGAVEVITGMDKIKTLQTVDRRGLVTKAIQDPEGLALVTQTRYNGLQQPTQISQGDSQQPNQYEEQVLRDGFGRPTGKVIDPKTERNPQGLAITTRQELNATGKVIAKIDANGHLTRYLYDAMGQLRYRINPVGDVIEWQYTATGKVASKRDYCQAIAIQKLSDKPTLTEVQSLLSPQPGDTQQYYYYDEKDQERFFVNGQGAVVEKRYNAAGQLIRTIGYAKRLETQALAALSYAKLNEQVTTLADAVNDRTIYRVLDNKGQERFLIDAEGYVIEKWFDAQGRVLAEIGYAAQIKDPAALASLPCEQVYAHIPKSVEDRATYYVFDALGRPEFTIGPEGNVIKYEYNANDQQVMECHFKEPIPIPEGYPNLVAKVRSLTPNPQVDRITRKAYDAGKRLTQVIDAQGNNDDFVPNALGDTTAHTDREGHTWQYKLDRARRVTKEIAPPTVITTVYKKQPLSSTMNGLLDCKQEVIALEKDTAYDKAGNPIEVIEASNTPEKRTVKFDYTPLNKLRVTTVEGVAVDEPAQPALLTTRPETIKTLNTVSVYDARELEVVKSDALGRLTFTVYDSEKRPQYKVESGKGVIKFERNAFGEVEKEICYAIPLELDTLAYIATGIPQAVIEQHIKTSPEDRITLYRRDRRGNVILQQKGPIFYYQPNEKDMESGTGYAETLCKYNAFRECILQGVLVDSNHNYAIHIWWYNRAGQVIAESDPIWRYKRYVFNAFGEMEERKEFANGLTRYPEGLPVAEVDKLIQPAPNDRVYRISYNLLGLKISEIQLGVTLQSIALSESHVPSMQDYTVDLIRRFLYNKVGKPIGMVYENGGTEYTYVNALGQVIAKADVPRDTHNLEGTQLIKLIPLTYYGVNPFGQQVLSIRFKQGTAHADESGVPSFISHDAQDQYTFTLMNNLGLPIYEQDGEGNVVFKTYTAARKLARHYHPLSNWQVGKNWQQQGRVVQIEEVRLSYDSNDRGILVTHYRDNALLMATQTVYNTFGERVLEGPGDGTFAIYWHYDTLGHCWLTNENKGVPTITLTDRQSQPTLTAKSPTQDLSNVKYSQFAEGFLALGPEQLECTVKVRDYAKRVRFVLSPLYLQNGTWIRPVSHINYDAWDNVWQMYDTKGNLTQYYYNALDKLTTLIKPGVNAVQWDGSQQWVNPVERYGYDARGKQVGKMGANGATTALLVNQAGQLIHRILPDGTIELTQVWDALGRIVQERDSRWLTWNMQYNRVNGMIASVSPMGRRNEFALNERNQRFYAKNPGGFGWGYNYNAQNKVELRIESNGYNTIMLYGSRGFLWKIILPDVGVQEFARDYWGDVLSEGDIGGVITYKQYDFKKQLVKQTTAYNERHGASLQILAIQYEKHNIHLGPALDFPTNLPYFTLGVRGKVNQYLEFSYAGDFLKEVKDYATGYIYQFERDPEGNRVAMRVRYFSGEVMYESATQLDALGQEICTVVKIGGLQMHHENAFDVESNLRHETHWLAYLDNTGIYSWDRWQGFDAVNRVIRQSVNKSMPKAKQPPAISYGYNQGYRTQEQYDGNLPYYLHYDGDGFITSIEVERPSKFKPTRQTIANFDYHPVGWLRSYNGFFIGGKINCNDNGWLLSSEAGDNKTYNTSFSPLGLPLTQDNYGSFIKQNPDGKTEIIYYRDSLTNNYVGIGNELQLTQVIGTRTQSDGASLTNSARLLYDVNGNPSGIIRWSHPSYIHYPNSPYHRLMVFGNTYNGIPLWRATFDTHGCTGDTFWATRDNLWEHYFYRPDGNFIGNQEFGISLLGSSWPTDIREMFPILASANNIDGAWDDYYQFAKTHAGYTLGALDNGFQAAYNLSNGHVLEWGETHTNLLNVLTVVKPLAANYSGRPLIVDESMEGISKEQEPLGTIPFNSSLLPAPPQYHVAGENETFAAIAKQYKGTSKLARAIAKANGYQVHEIPPAGYKLFIPIVYSDYCQADDTVPFSEIRAKIIGSIQPYLAIIPPPPEQDDDGDFWSGLLETFVPLVIGVLLAPFTGGLSLTTTMLIGGLTSAATQLIVSGRINLVTTLESAVLAGIGGGLASLPEFTFKAVMDCLCQFAIINGTEQMVEIIANQREDFDLGGMLAFAVAQTANAALQGRFNTKAAEKQVAEFADKLILREEQLLISNVSAWALTGAPLNAKNLAGQMTGIGLGSNIQQDYEDRQAKSKSNQMAELAANGKGLASEQAKAAIPTRYKGPGLFLHIPEEDEVSQIPDISADDIINGLKRGNAAHSSQQAADEQQPTRTQRYQQSVQPSRNWLESMEDSLAYAGVEANIGMRYAMGEREFYGHTLDVIHQPLPDMLNFGVGAMMGYAAQAIPYAEGGMLLLESKAIQYLGKGILDGSAALISKFSGVWSKEELINLYRAVKPEELKQLLETKTFKNPYGIENKYFSTSLDGASQYAKMAEGSFGDPPYTIIKTSISRSNFDAIPSYLKETVDRGIEATLIPTENLNLLSQPKIVNEEVITQLIQRRLIDVNP